MSLHEKISNVKQKLNSSIFSSQLWGLMKSSWEMSWPMILVMFFEFFMNITDVYIAGLFGKEVKASVGLSSQIYTFFIMSGHAITVGTVSVVSRLYGGEDRLKYRSAVFTAVSSACVAGIIVGILGAVFAPTLISLLNAGDSIKGYAIPLLRIYSIGFFFHMVLINMNGILRSSKMIKMTMKIMILAATLNIILNVIFLNFTDLHYLGIALSTAISVFVAFLIAFRIIYKLIDKTYIFSKKLFKSIISIGWPSGIVSISWQLGATLLYGVIGLLHIDSVEVMAAYTTGLRIESAIFLPAFAFNMANAVIVGNLMGEKKYDQAFKSGLITAGISVAIVSIMTLVVILNARSIADVLDKNPNVISEVMKYLYICMISEPFIALNLAMAGALNGAGDTKATMLYAVTTVWAIRLPLAYLLGIYLDFGSSGLWWAFNIGFFIHAFLSTRRYLSKKWQLKNI